MNVLNYTRSKGLDKFMPTSGYWTELFRFNFWIRHSHNLLALNLQEGKAFFVACPALSPFLRICCRLLLEAGGWPAPSSELMQQVLLRAAGPYAPLLKSMAKFSFQPRNEQRNYFHWDFTVKGVWRCWHLQFPPIWITQTHNYICIRKFWYWQLRFFLV